MEFRQFIRRLPYQKKRKRHRTMLAYSHMIECEKELEEIRRRMQDLQEKASALSRECLEAGGGGIYKNTETYKEHAKKIRNHLKFINSFNNDTVECAICLKEESECYMFFVTLPCHPRHIVCTTCFRSIRFRQVECPVCRMCFPGQGNDDESVVIMMVQEEEDPIL